MLLCSMAGNVVGFATGVGDIVVRVCNWVVIVSILVIVLGISGDIVSRVVLNRSIWGVEEIILSAGLYLWFAAWVYATYKRYHIGADPALRNPLLKAINTIVDVALCLIITLVFCYLSYQYCTWIVASHSKTITFGVPLIYTISVVFIGLVITAGYIMRQMVECVRAFLRSRV